MSTQMKCPSCGYTDEGKFCKHCGATLVSEAKAAHVGAPQFTGVTIPPPTATEGFKAERDIDEVGVPTEEGEESWSGSFGIILIVVIVAALALFAIRMVGRLH